MNEAGEKIADVVRARHFELVDHDGRVRGALGLSADGEPALLLTNELAEPRAALSLQEDGEPVLALFDAANTLRVALGIDAEGDARLVLTDAKGEERMVLEISSLDDGDGDRDGRQARRRRPLCPHQTAHPRRSPLASPSAPLATR